MSISILFFCSSEVKARNSQWMISIEEIEKKYLTAVILTFLFLHHFCSFLLDIFLVQDTPKSSIQINS